MKQDFYDKKVIVLDLNFWELNQHTVDEKIYTKKFLKELTANQNVIITTNNAWFEAIKGVEDLGLKTGYLISNAGATITNIATQKTIHSGEIELETVLRICHLCVWNNLHFSLVTDETRYPFNLSYWLIKRYKEDLSYLHKHMPNTLHLTPEIRSTVQKSAIRKIEIYFLNKDRADRNKEMMRLANLFPNEIDYCISGSTLHIVPKGQRKINNITKIMEELEGKVSLPKDGIYAAINQYDYDVAKNSYFQIIKHELADEMSEEERGTLEVLSIGEVSWVKWFYNHEHLWSGDSKGKIEKTLNKYKECPMIPNSLISLQNGKTKYISIEKGTKNNSITEKVQLNFWPQQVPQAVSVLKKYQWNSNRI